MLSIQLTDSSILVIMMLLVYYGETYETFKRNTCCSQKLFIN